MKEIINWSRKEFSFLQLDIIIVNQQYIQSVLALRFSWLLLSNLAQPLIFAYAN